MKKELAFNKIAKKHLPLLKNKNRKNKKVIIAFAGIPGSGKTTLAKILEKKYKAVRINSSVIGKVIKDLSMKDDSRHTLQNQYRAWLIKQGLIKNGAIILDSGIERKYPKIAKTARQENFKLFIICLKVPRKILIQRIKQREKLKSKIYLNALERWTRDFNKFNKKYRSDITINNDKKPNFKPIFKKLDKLL